MHNNITGDENAKQTLYEAAITDEPWIDYFQAQEQVFAF